MAICLLLCRFSDQYPCHGYWYAITNKEDLFRQGIIYYLDTLFPHMAYKFVLPYLLLLFTSYKYMNQACFPVPYNTKLPWAKTSHFKMKVLKPKDLRLSFKLTIFSRIFPKICILPVRNMLLKFLELS